LLPYLGLTAFISIPVLTAFGLNRSIWRLSAMADYLRAAVATLVIVAATVVLGFLLNRLEGIARSLPILQVALVLCALVGVRVAARLHHAGDGRPPAPNSPLLYAPARSETVLLVGINRITELYLRSLTEYALDHIKVAGLITTKERHIGRLVQEHKILGTPEELPSILRNLEVHGVYTERIVVTAAFDTLSSRAQAALLDVERSSGVKVEFFADNIGMVGRTVHRTARNALLPNVSYAFESKEPIFERPFWRMKRATDVVVATTALIFLVPLIALVAALVAIDVGLPAIFWQQRPGKDGRPFRLYKFRTMCAPHNAQGDRIADPKRLSIIGRALRRLRLDELPQLYNVLVGEMSFIGPRPLLPQDQFPALAARFAIRPGLTGWAQIK